MTVPEETLWVALNALYLEAPGSVVDDVRAKADAVVSELRAVRADNERLREALGHARGQLSLGPDGDKARELLNAALAASAAPRKDA